MTRYALRFRDGRVQVKNVEDDQEIARFQARGDREIFVFDFSKDGRYLATTHFRGFALTVWDIDRQAAAVNDPGPVYGYSARFSPDSRSIALFHQNDRELQIYDLATGRLKKRWLFPVPGNLAFRPDGAQIAVVHTDSEKSMCQIRDAETGQVALSFPLPLGGGGYVAWSSDGATLAMSCDDSKIYLWDAATGIRRATLEGSTNIGLSAAFHPAGTLLASNGWEGRLRLWDAVLGRPVLSLTSAAVNDCRFSQDGRIVVSLEDELTTYQVDPALEYRTFAHAFGERVRYERASIRRDGRVLAVGTDRGVALWDLARGTELAFLPIGHTRHLTFEASGALLTSGSAGVRRWPVQLEFDRGEFRIGSPRQLPFPCNMAGIAEDRLGRIVALANFGATHVLTPDRKFEVRPLDDVPLCRRQPGRQMVGDR